MPTAAPRPPLPGRLPADAVFPAGRPGHAVRRLSLPGGERARAVVCAPVPAAPGLDAPPRPAVVALHGWGCSAYTFQRVLRPLADRGFAAAAPDLRGHGWSDKPLDRAAYAPGALAAWLVAVLDALGGTPGGAAGDAIGARPVVLLAHSLGAHVALEAALAAPGRVAGLVLTAPLGFAPLPRLRALRLATPPALAPLLPHLATRAAVRLAVASSYGPRHVPTARDVDEYWAPTADPDFARAVCLVAHASDWAPAPAHRLARVGCPTRLVVGDRDNLIPAAAVRRAAAALPRGAVEVLPGVGHVPPDEAPDRVIAAIEAVAAAATAPEAAAAPAPAPAAG